MLSWLSCLWLHRVQSLRSTSFCWPKLPIYCSHMPGWLRLPPLPANCPVQQPLKHSRGVMDMFCIGSLPLWWCGKQEQRESPPSGLRCFTQSRPSVAMTIQLGVNNCRAGAGMELKSILTICKGREQRKNTNQEKARAENACIYACMRIELKSVKCILPAFVSCHACICRPKNFTLLAAGL